MKRYSLAAVLAAMLCCVLASPVVSAAVADPSPDTIFGSATPANVDSGDGNSVNLGVSFQAAQSGSITGIRFYKASANTGTQVVTLWTSSGTELAQATTSDGTAQGWQTVAFAAPVAIAAGTTYVASYYAPNGHYSYDAGGLRSSITNGPLTALGGSTGGVFAYGSSTAFPTDTYGSANYWVDVDFVPTPTPTLTADTIFGSSTPVSVDSGDGNSVNLGVSFQAAESGSITGVRFYKASTNTGTHVGSLWTSAGSLLAQATFSNETASGWQSVNFSSPVAISAGTTYVAGYYAPAGHYSDDQNGLSSSVANGPLTAIGNSTSADGVYAYGSSPSFPSSAWNASNYYVDVNFVPGSGSGSTPPPVSTPPPGLQTLNCFASPMLCGYPDPAAPAGNTAHVGPAQSCSSMTQVNGNVTTSSSGQTIQNETINGMLYVNEPNVTIDNVCVITPDSDSGPSIYLESGADNTVVENTSAGAADRDASTMESAIYNWSSQPATMDDDYFYNCGECIHDGSETVSNSYVNANGMDGTSDHREAMYDSDGPVVFDHDTMFVAPEDTPQVAVFFTSNAPAPPAGTTLEVQDSLLAGGDYVYEGGSTVTSDFTDDHFARCTTGPMTETSDGGTACDGYTGSSSNSDAKYTWDANGYWPNVGVGGIAMDIDCSSPDVWSANVYDDDGASVSCP